MATKNSVTTAETAKANADKRARTVVTVNVPKEGAGGEKSIWLCVNGKPLSFPRGSYERIPRKYADLLRYRRMAQREADKFNEEAEKKMNESARRTNVM